MPSPERCRQAAELYLLLGTLQQAADHLGVTREWVRQLIAKGRDYGVTDVLPAERRRELTLAGLRAKLAAREMRENRRAMKRAGKLAAYQARGSGAGPGA